MQDIGELIRRRRAQLMVHSYVYYELNDSMVTDDVWQAWAQELVDLQTKHPEPIGFFDDLFNGWTGDTGYHLTKNKWVRGAACDLSWNNNHTKRPFQ
jgi:hypothetical protein